MGKSNNSQPTHSVVGVEPFAGSSPAHKYVYTHSSHRGLINDVGCPRQTDAVSTTKLTVPPVVNVIIPSQPPSPSPQTTSEYFDAHDWSDDDDEEDLFYDACDALLEQPKPARSDIIEDILESQYEGAAKGATAGRKPRAGLSRNTVGTAPVPTFPFSPAFASTSVRGIAKPTSAPGTEASATSLAAKQAQRAVPPPVREPRKRALVVSRARVACHFCFSFKN
jgi:hypothetical protein